MSAIITILLVVLLGIFLLVYIPIVLMLMAFMLVMMIVIGVVAQFGGIPINVKVDDEIVGHLVKFKFIPLEKKNDT